MSRPVADGRCLRALCASFVLVLAATSCAPLPHTFGDGPATLAAPAPWPLAIDHLATAGPRQPTLAREGVVIPSTLSAEHPVPVLLALHGMGGTGPRLAQRLRDCAEQNGWILVAPSLTYGDYMDADQVRLEDGANLPLLHALVDDVLANAHEIHMSDEIFVYGYSRGAQLAHRFALFYPERVAGVAAVAAGSYTLPRLEHAFPFGMADLPRYAGREFDPEALTHEHFWVGVGGLDTAAGEVARPWDRFLGRTRLDRATRFADALRAEGADVTLNVFPGEGHEESANMRRRACDFLGTLTPLRRR